MEHEYVPPKKPTDADVPKAPVAPEKAGFFRGNILRFITGELPAESIPAPEQTQTPDKIEEAPKTEEQLEYERAGRVRRFARTVLRAVMAEATAESARPKPLDTEPLTEAAEDLREATTELNATMEEARGKPTDADGFEFAPPEAPRHIFEDVVAERIAARMQRLEAEPEKTRTVSVLAAGLGIVAVLVAGHQYLARRRADSPHDAITNQRTEFKRLRTEHTADMARNQRQDHYEKLREFTHHQAEVTRGAAHELKEVTDRPRLTWMREQAPAAVTLEQKPAPPIDPSKPPLNPAAMRQEAARKARAAQLASTAWLYGAALAAIVFAVTAFILLG
jgi:hypothetical protein